MTASSHTPGIPQKAGIAQSHVLGLDHLVLTVADIAATVAFYEGTLGFGVLRSPEGRFALDCGGQKINLHQAGREFSPHALRPVAGSGDFCCITAIAVEELAEKLAARNVPLVAGPVTRTGRCGPLLSIYLRDPDGNLVELANRLDPVEDALP